MREGEHSTWFCKLCNISFSLEKELKKHDRTCHRFCLPKIFKCHLCKSLCGSTFQLKFHYLREHNESSPLNFTCNLCGKVYTSKSHFEKHISQHNKKPFECEICKRLFSFERELKKHTWSHLPEKPFQCDVCNISFKKSWLLYRHFETRKHKQIANLKTGNVKFENELVKRRERIYDYGSKSVSVNVKQEVDPYLNCSTEIANNNVKLELTITNFS